MFDNLIERNMIFISINIVSQHLQNIPCATVQFHMFHIFPCLEKLRIKFPAFPVLCPALTYKSTNCKICPMDVSSFNKE